MTLSEFGCTPESVSDVLPQLLDNSTGSPLFTIPSPKADLDAYFNAQNALTRAIDVALHQSMAGLSLTEANKQEWQTIRFGSAWRSAEVGITTVGGAVPTIEKAYGGPSFIDGAQVVPGTADRYFEVVDEAGARTSLLSAFPTTLPCVNTIMLAEETSAGTWMPPSYALGRPGEDAWLIVDRCVDLAAPTSSGALLSPSASLYIAIQWADVPEFAHMRTDQAQSMMHREPAQSSSPIQKLSALLSALLSAGLWSFSRDART